MEENKELMKAEKKNKVKKDKVPMDKKKKKRIRRWVLIIAAVLIVVFFILTSVLGNKGAQVIVATSAVTKGEIEQTIKTSGTISADEYKAYFSDVNAKIGKVNVKAGDAVKTGDILITYDSESLNSEKQLAQLKIESTEGSYKNTVQGNNEKLGNLGEASTNLDVLDQQILDTETYITNLNSKIEKKKKDLAHEGTLLQISLLDWADQPNSDEYMNLQKLVQLNSYEQQNNKEVAGWQDELEVYNKMLTEYKEYRAEMKSQKSAADAAKMTSGGKQELEANNETQAIQATQSLSNIEAVEEGIKAEFDGVVTEITALEGATPVSGTQLLKVESTQEVSVKLTVTKYDLEKIAVGQKAVVTIGAKSYDGEVSKINKMAEKNSSGAAVVGTEIKITNPDSGVILGVEAKVVISTAKENDTIIIPVGAVNVDMEGEFVYTLENGILVRKPIVTGISSDTMIQVAEGLKEGDQIVTEVTPGVMEGIQAVAIPQ